MKHTPPNKKSSNDIFNIICTCVPVLKFASQGSFVHSAPLFVRRGVDQKPLTWEDDVYQDNTRYFVDVYCICKCSMYIVFDSSFKIEHL